MLNSGRLLCVLFVLWASSAWGQTTAPEPRIGYIYPAGGQAGSEFVIAVGGQSLRGATDVYVSGEGVHTSIIQYMRPLRNLNKDQRELIQKRLKQVRDWRLAELSLKSKDDSVKPKAKPTRKVEARTGATKKAGTGSLEVKLPDHPLLYDLNNKSLRELAHAASIIFARRSKLQMNRQLSESVLVKIRIDKGATPGDRELRVRTAAGLTNPMVFQTGQLPEVRELEPNNRLAYPPLPGLPDLPKEKAVELPAVFNGQVMPGDVDRFRFRAEEGQQLVIQAQARSLIPYLADAVPGWFQATLALYDDEGKEVAFADDYRFNPDPVLFYKIGESGEYELEIRDSLYRGRQDFIYRIAVGEEPFITQVFPLGGKAGVGTVAEIDGWNLTANRLPLDTKGDVDGIRQTAYQKGKRLSNPIAYAVDELPECNEKESNNSMSEAQQIALPQIVNGRIDKPGDVDVFRLKGKAGEKVVAQVYGRCLNSPLDSVLRITDSMGKVIAWNDDFVIKDKYLYEDAVGLLTHHADSYLTAQLPTDGVYYVHLADTQRHGGAAYGYRLRISEPRPDFAIRVTPSSINLRSGGMAPVDVHVLRKDGFDGEIEMTLKDAPKGFKLSGGRIPAGCDHIRMTLAAPVEAPDEPVALQLAGSSQIDGKTVSRSAVPAEDMMQAFLYRHLVPAQELLVAVKKSRFRAPSVELVRRGPVRIPAGGMAQVRLRTAKRPALNQVQLVLKDPPEGLTLRNVRVVADGLAFQLKADKDSMPSGYEDNLIVEAFTRVAQRGKNGKPTGQKRRISMGILPAIPIKIVQ